MLLAAALPAAAQETAKWPGYQESDFVVKDYTFSGGESMQSVKLHYRTIGIAKRNAQG